MPHVHSVIAKTVSSWHKQVSYHYGYAKRRRPLCQILLPKRLPEQKHAPVTHALWAVRQATAGGM